MTSHRPDLRYGPTSAEALDFFPAAQDDAPLLIFIHGGYWRAFDKSDFSWIAPPYVRAGVSVAVVNYGLAPGTPLETIVEQSRRACQWLHRCADGLRFDRNRIVCSGHSAGGHLTAMIACDGIPPLDPRLLAGAVTISALADLEPLVNVEFLKGDLRLDLERARLLSPVRMRPAARAPLLAAVGQLESSEFRRQTRILAEGWGGSMSCRTLTVANTHHLSVCDAFATPGNELFEATLALLNSKPPA
jgi:arylformamidase